jgi:glucan biosynthesis protein C
VVDMTEPALHSPVAAEPATRSAADPRRRTAVAPRDAAVDNLRVALSALVVAHHALQPYGFNQNWWVIERVPPAPVLGLFLWVNACYFMGLFFLIAGLFTPGSVDRKGIGPYVRDRNRRLGIPLLFGFFVMLPPLGWYAHLHNRHMGWVPFSEYFVHFWLGVGPRPIDWPEAHWPDGHFGHLWFLEHLLLYGLLYALWRKLRPRRAPAGGPPPSNAAIALYAVGLGVVSWAVRLWYPMNAWTGLLGFIQSEPAHLPQYASLFAIGVLAGRRGWFASLPAATGWRWLGIGVAAALFGCVRGAATGGIAVNSLDTCLLEAFVCTGLSVGLLVACRERWNGAGWVSALAPDTYAVYVFHVAVLVALQYALLSLPLGALGKAAIVVPAGIVLSFALCHFVVRRLPGARRVF